MKYIQLILVFVTFSTAISCTKETNKKITNTKDYEAYLVADNSNSLETLTTELNFWKTKLNISPNQYPYNLKIASANARLFKMTGNINELKLAEKNILEANERINYSNAGYLRTLARNYISQHRFKEALILIKKAELNGQNLKETQYMMIDLYLELGNYPKVEEYLSKVKNFKSFDYLIRLSKYNDHIGNLEKAIACLEASLKIAKQNNNSYLMEWNYTNLGDYYGHAGRIKDSYNCYLKALELNANDSYAKKGIAWIVYSYERNPKEALRILENVTKNNVTPDYNLIKAEIADFMGNNLEKQNYISKYIERVSDENYGVMYQKYDVLVYAKEAKKTEKALKIAKQEVLVRATSQSYDLLAWSYFKNGDTKKALEISQKYVIDKTFEPHALLHAAYILKANGKLKDANMLKNQLLNNIYELGPILEKEIRNI